MFLTSQMLASNYCKWSCTVRLPLRDNVWTFLECGSLLWTVLLRREPRTTWMRTEPSCQQWAASSYGQLERVRETVPSMAQCRRKCLKLLSSSPDYTSLPNDRSLHTLRLSLRRVFCLCVFSPNGTSNCDPLSCRRVCILWLRVCCFRAFSWKRNTTNLEWKVDITYVQLLLSFLLLFPRLFLSIFNHISVKRSVSARVFFVSFFFSCLATHA